MLVFLFSFAYALSLLPEKEEKMKRRYIALSQWAVVTLALTLQAQQGPFDPENWPPTIDPNAWVAYVDVEGTLPNPGGWSDHLEILTGGDQVTEDITIGGHKAKKVVGTYLNVADSLYEVWASEDTIDILVLAYGNDALIGSSESGRDVTFLTGTLPEVHHVVGGHIPPEAKNGKWNWILFRISNDIRPSDGQRYVGTLPANAQGDYSNGGVNGGTIRFEGVNGWIVRVIAFGPKGAFGEPDQINHFAPPEECDPEPPTNLVWIDIDKQETNHLVVLNNGDQTVTFVEGVGPENDKRRAVRPNGLYLNFGITDTYLGKPCNDPRAMKICVEFYDDPAFAGQDVRFGPEAYAVDAMGDLAFYPPEKRHLLQGTGKWIRRSWVVPGVNLHGVNTEPYTGGPRFISENGQVCVSKVQIAILRVGDHPLAGQDPLSDCYQDPLFCSGVYGNYAELDLDRDIKNGLDLGRNGGDQEWVVEEAGPPDDRRLAVRPAFDDGVEGPLDRYLNFAIVDEALGPTSQDPVLLAICVTYYDDPALQGAWFRPEAYWTEINGVETMEHWPSSENVVLEGTGTWRTAYWEIPGMKFRGVNQKPQAAARFVFSDKIYITRVRYGVIRPCGPDAGVNPIADCKPKPEEIQLTIRLADKDHVEIRWSAEITDAVLQQTDSLFPAQWTPVSAQPEQVEDQYVVTLPIEKGQKRYFRLQR